MRLTFVTHFPGRGGSTSLLLQLREFFTARGHAIEVVCGSDDPEPQLADYHVVPERRRRRDRRLAYLETLAATRPELVYVISGIEEFDVTRFVQVPRVRHIFSLERHERADIPRLVRRTGDFTELFTANTPDVLENLRQWTRLAPAQFALVPYRLHERWFSFSPSAEKPPFPPVRICFSGRLDRGQKRAHWLPEIVRILDQSSVDYRFEIAGDGPEAPALAHVFRAHPRVTMHGWLGPDALRALYRQCHVFFLCSRWEGLPVAMAEAMTCGLTCVVPDQPGGMAATVRLAGAGQPYSASTAAAAGTALLEAARNSAALMTQGHRAATFAAEVFAPARVDESLHTLNARFQQLRPGARVLAAPHRAAPLRAVNLMTGLRRKAGEFLLRAIPARKC